jgi:hypothetical protein
MRDLGVKLAPAILLVLVGCASHADAVSPHVATTSDVPPPKPAALPTKPTDPPVTPVALPSGPQPSRSCAVRWSSDGSQVAGVSDRAVEIRSVAGSQAPRILPADPGTRTLDYSFVADMVLRERGSSVELAKPGAQDPYFKADPTKWLPPIVMSDDGAALFHSRTEPEGGIDDTTFLDLHTFKETPIAVPYFSAGGSDQVASRVRRESIEVGQSRILRAIYDYRTPTTAKNMTHGLSLPNCFATEGEGTAKFFAMDVDQSFETAVVARVACEKKGPKKPVIEVYDRIKDGDAHVSHSWAPNGNPIALDVSANGKRVVVSLERKDGLVRELWDTTTGKRVGDITLQADCFELSPDGSRIASMQKSQLDVKTVP